MFENKNAIIMGRQTEFYVSYAFFSS